MRITSDEEIRLLSLVDGLEPLSQEQLQILAQRYPDLYIKEGKHLYTPQEASERLYLLKKGRMRQTHCGRAHGPAYGALTSLLLTLVFL
jgi:hypothetical protein